MMVELCGTNLQVNLYSPAFNIFCRYVMGTNCFCLFRLFDVWKPWPIRVADQKVAGGFGIMLDDIIAGFGGTMYHHIYYFLGRNAI